MSNPDGSLYLTGRSFLYFRKSFEITERSDIENYQILQQIMKHYADQGYEIALDDV